MTPTDTQVGDQWCEWKGGENPLPGRMVDVRFRGFTVDDQMNDSSGVWDWRHFGGSFDIIAYRPAAPSASVSPGMSEANEPKSPRPTQGEAEGMREKVAIADEWLSLVEDLPLEAAGSILRWAPICQTEIDAIRAILAALSPTTRGEG